MLFPMLRALFIWWLVVAAAFAVTTWILSGMTISGGFFAYLWISLLFGIVNAIVGTFLRIITLPIIILTLGLFMIIINAVLLEIVDALSSHLTIDSFFWSAIWGALILAVVSVCLQLVVGAFVNNEPAQ
jgi:putative membrane protein